MSFELNNQCDLVKFRKFFLEKDNFFTVKNYPVLLTVLSFQSERTRIALSKKTHMTKYLNKSGKSSVLGYSFTENSISILFKDQKFIYTYNDRKPGVLNVQKMIQYAMAGKGLNGYIKKNIQSNYFSKTGN